MHVRSSAFKRTGFRHGVWGLVAMSAWVGGTLVATPVSRGAEEGSPLRVEPWELELGRVPQHEVVPRQIVLSNEGLDTITIKHVGRTCPSCLTFSIDQSDIPPGAVAVVDVLYDPSGYEGDVEEHVVLETDHDGVGNLAIPLRARVVKPYALKGAPVFMEAEAERPAARRVRVTPAFDMKGELTGLASPDERFDVRIEPVGRSFAVEIISQTGLPAGLSQAVLELISSNPDDPPCPIEASVFVVPPYHVYPSALKIGPVDRRQMRILFTRQSLVPPARILDVEVPDEGILYEFLPHGLAETRLNLYFYGMKGRNGHIGDVVLRTDHPEAGDVAIPIWVSKDFNQRLIAPALPREDRKKGCCGGT